MATPAHKSMGLTGKSDKPGFLSRLTGLHRRSAGGSPYRHHRVVDPRRGRDTPALGAAAGRSFPSTTGPPG